MPVEQQVMIVYAVTNGFLDEVPVAEIRAWERGFLEYMSAQFPQVGDKIRSEKALSKELEAELKRGIEAYQKMAGKGTAPAARPPQGAPAAAGR
jgi:F-type H+-transporting ATPase subunit alpha